MVFELLEPLLNLALVVPAFSSLPGANHTIYLDFDGHVTTGTAWNSSNGVTSIDSPAYSPAYSSDADKANFSDAELTTIQQTWKRVAEDYAPFQVNVTTVAPTVDDLRKIGEGTSTTGYSQGHGLGTDSTYWSTIMGVGYYVNASQWDTGSNKANSNDFTGGFPNNVLVDFASGTTAVDVTILVNADSTVERCFERIDLKTDRNQRFNLAKKNNMGFSF